MMKKIKNLSIGFEQEKIDRLRKSEDGKRELRGKNDILLATLRIQNALPAVMGIKSLKERIELFFIEDGLNLLQAISIAELIESKEEYTVISMDYEAVKKSFSITIEEKK